MDFAISIHPPRVGWDGEIFGDRLESDHFNPPAPCGVGPICSGLRAKTSLISIHPPRVGWDEFFAAIGGVGCISIHPPRVGWDFPGSLSPQTTILFQSTHPVWGGTSPG